MSRAETRAAVDAAVRSALARGGLDRRIAVAFSGGTDSTALLRSLVRVSSGSGHPTPVALHVDHGLDRGSSGRAELARQLAAASAVRCVVLPAAPEDHPPGARSRGLEADARDRRYRALAAAADAEGAAEIWTAHHLDDQAETVLLRLLHGTGLAGLGGIEPARGRWVRPLLGLSRATLAASIDGELPLPIEDPTNRDSRRPRNRLRHGALPTWTHRRPELPARLASLAGSARAFRTAVESLVAARTRIEPTPWGARLSRPDWEGLPEVLRPWALAVLHRTAGAAYPARRTARRELRRQLDSGRAVGCPAGAGYRWEADSRELRLVAPGTRTPPFAYTVHGARGHLPVREIGARLHFDLHSPAPGTPDPADRLVWMRPPAVDATIRVRNRRPGDRFHPVGASGRRKLKDVLIDHRISRPDRDRLPLLLVDDEIAWIPGLAVSERFRLRGGEQVVWAVELVPEPSVDSRGMESIVGSFGLDRA